MQSVVDENTAQLEQVLILLKGLEPDLYTLTDPPLYSGSVGDHIRHILEHYLCFLEGCKSYRIDYEARKRDVLVSKDRHAAMKTVQRITDALQNLPIDDSLVRVNVASSVGERALSAWSSSTVKRELQFLLAHTIHHFALIAMLLRLNGVHPPDHFGLAPSTLRFRREQAETALRPSEVVS